MRLGVWLWFFLLLGVTARNCAEARDLSTLKILYIGDKEPERGMQFVSFLQGHVASVASVNRDDFRPDMAATYDVVLLDWPPVESVIVRKNWGSSLSCPLGAREKWTKPTVLLGSAGLNVAATWQVRGGVGCTCLHPLAYGMQDHEIFQKPFKIDCNKTVTISTPPAFQDEIKQPTIQVLPLVDDMNRNWMMGWCTYSTEFAAYPDVEYFSGGVNHKTPTAAAVWRQGNLLHFGFEQSPTEMNQTGRDLLLNSIAYISQFSQDRPIAYTPSPFSVNVARSRRETTNILANWPTQWLPAMIGERFSPALATQLQAKSRQELVAWAAANAKFLRPDQNNQYEIDQDLRAMNVSFDQPELLDLLLQQLNGHSQERARGQRLAQRYLPDMPTTITKAATAWVNENRPYLFASDVGDYRWYIDPLAKERRIPTLELRGPKRADIPNLDTPGK